MQTQQYIMVNDGTRNFIVWLSFSYCIPRAIISSTSLICIMG